MDSLATPRLLLTPIAVADSTFILELVNTKGWLEFIGDRNVRSIEDATAYIQKIIDNENVSYWIVKLNDEAFSIGVITLIKRDYLEHHDIGFSFLPEFTNRGYAHEAAKSFLTNIISNNEHKRILATTVQGNVNSIKLLKKLDFAFEKEIVSEKELLHVYTLSAIPFNPS